jgi:hypothetical protein
LLKIKVFAWLLISDRLNTKDMIKRRHWNVTDEYHCILCSSHTYEDKIHLFCRLGLILCLSLIASFLFFSVLYICIWWIFCLLWF